MLWNPRGDRSFGDFFAPNQPFGSWKRNPRPLVASGGRFMAHGFGFRGSRRGKEDENTGEGSDSLLKVRKLGAR